MALDKETFNQLLASIEKFVANELIPMEKKVSDDDAVPPAIIEQMKEMGLFGLSIPEEYGGIGLSVEEEAHVIQKLGYASPAFRSVIGTNVGIGSQGILIDGTEEQKQRYLPRMASGKLVGSFALTEPDAGSDAGSVRTTARLEGDHYVVNGTKRYITNANRAGVFTLMARTGTVDEGSRGVTAFLMDADLPGIELGVLNEKMGQRGAHICDVIMKDVKIPKDAIIGGVPNKGFITAMKVLDRGRLHMSAVALGCARRLIDDSLSYALERKQFNQRIADFQLIQAMLADSETEYFAGKCMVEETARMFDNGGRLSRYTAACKLYCTEMVGRVADRAVQIHGGSGYIADYAVERFYRDVRIFRLYEGTSQIQQLLIAKEMIRDHER
ncbi:MAG: acyl-CoA dehydrogenase [Porticoccaceae bacterium]|nr:acyl-CoA dehydrogenase [Porticoccaceae bacterium]MBT5102488.1 acyl-CoA dehydrogenase [Porticoccaceae bacterium]MBT6027222.1 acyl-CoA dehydrogenase [Porticoccaceae bacterium]